MRPPSLLALMVLLLGCVGSPDEGPSEPPRMLKGTPVTLTLSSGHEIAAPSDDQIRQALAGLDVQRDGEGFAILARSEITYLQVSGDRQIGFDMEYQEGSTEHHFRARREDFSLDEVVDAFASYRDGREEWWKTRDWQDISW